MTARMLVFVAGMITGSLVAGSFDHGGTEARRQTDLPGLGTTVLGQAPARYESKVVLENERVRVKDVTFPPGVLDTGMHTHDLAHVGVILTKGSLVFTEQDGKRETVAFEAGSVGFRGPKATHQVANPGREPMRVIEVELK